MAHSPALDAAGLLQPGSRLLLTPNSGKCKTAYAMQLLEDEKELVLVNPICANKIVHSILDKRLIPSLSEYCVARAEVKRGDSRFDFQLQHRINSDKELLLEVKFVPTVDIASDAPEPLRKAHFIVRSSGFKGDGTYSRSALFPVDRRQQKHCGRPVVSERAIRHVMGLQSLQKKGINCCVLFLVGRGDAQGFRPCHESCPVFSEELLKAQTAGVKVVAAQVKWDWKGRAAFTRELPVFMHGVSAKQAGMGLEANSGKKLQRSMQERRVSKAALKPKQPRKSLKRPLAHDVHMPEKLHLTHA